MLSKNQATAKRPKTSDAYQIIIFESAMKNFITMLKAEHLTCFHYR